MAQTHTMLGLQGPPPLSTAQLHAHLDALAHKRGVAPWAARFDAHTISTPDGDLHADVIEDAGRGAPTVIFAPGTNAYALLYGELLVALSALGMNVVGMDPRGHGRSWGKRGSATLSGIVRDLQATVTWARARWDGPVIVGGSSQGGIAAFYCAAHDPSLAGALCHNIADLGDPASACLTRTPELNRRLWPWMGLLGRLAPDLPVPMTAYLDLKREPVAGLGTAYDVLKSDPLTVPFVRLAALASLATTPLPCPVEAIKPPIMVLQAGDDTIFPTAYVRGLVDRLTCPKRLNVYPGLGHYMIADNVPRFIDDVTDWLRACLPELDREWPAAASSMEATA